MFSSTIRSAVSRKHLRRPVTRLTLQGLEGRDVPSVTYTPVDFSAFHNTRFHTLQPASNTLPEGDVVLGGIPFHIPVGGNNAWWGEAAGGAYPRSITVPVGEFGVTEVQTLLNTSYGQPGPASYVAVEFFGSDGAFYRKEMIGNVDVRDHFQAFWTNSINGTTTTNVATAGPGGQLNESRLDKQFIDLPDTFNDETLDRIRFIDTGGTGISGIILQGLTVGAEQTADVAATSVGWDSAQGGADFTVGVVGGNLPQPAQARLYWSPGAIFNPATATLAHETTVGPAQGAYGPLHVSAADLGPAPTGATHLLLVVDPAGAIAESDEANNVAAVPIPSLVVAGPDNVAEGSVYTLTLGEPTYPAAVNLTGYTIHWGDGLTTSLGAAGLPADRTVTHTYADGGPGGTPAAIIVDVSDATGTFAAVGSKAVAVTNVAPSATIGSVSEPRVAGNSITVTASATDPAGSADPLTFTWEVFNTGTLVAGGSGTDQTGFSFTPAATGTYDVVLTVADGDGGSAGVSRSVVVDNTAPLVDPVVGPVAPVAVGSPAPVTVSGSFTDADAGEAHTVVWNWGDGDTTTQVVPPGGATTFSASHFYQRAGSYPVAVTVTDGHGGSATRESAAVIAYDPSAGYVTGSGWVASPVGAVAADPTATGKMVFRLGARYLKNGPSPVGNTRFRVTAAGFRFQSTGFDWLLVNGDRAEYRGTGKVNGKDGYGVQLVAVDGRRAGVRGVDRLQVKIWDKATGQVVYDSQGGTGPGLTEQDGTTAIGGGAIRIVKPRR